MSEPAFELADLQAEVSTFFIDVLTLLAGVIPTPEKGYEKDGRFGLLINDLRSLVRKYESATVVHSNEPDWSMRALNLLEIASESSLLESQQRIQARLKKWFFEGVPRRLTDDAKLGVSEAAIQIARSSVDRLPNAHYLDLETKARLVAALADEILQLLMQVQAK